MKTNLYTSTGSWATGQTNQMDYVQIAQTPAATLLANGLSDPYLMGYIEHDKIPGFCKIGHPVNDGKNFHVDYVQENHGFGFCTLAQDQWFAHAIKQDGTLLAGQNGYYARFINSGTMASANYNLMDVDTITLSYVGVCEPLEYANDNAIFAAADSGTKFVYVSATNWTVNVSDLLNAITNNGYLTLTINNVFGSNRTFKIYPNSHNDYNLYSAVDDLNEIKIYFHFNYIVALPQATAYIRADLSTSDTIYMMPFFQSSFISDTNSALNPAIKIMTGMLKTRSYGDLRLRYDSSVELFGVVWTNFRIFDRYFIGNIPYNVDLQEIFNADTTQTTPFTSGKCGVVAGKFMFRAIDNNGSFNIFTSYTINDIYNLIFILHKHTIASGATLAELYTYANKAHVSLFDSDNKPLYEYEDGTATDPDFLAKLQPWQYPDTQITINEFAPEDVPEYNPPEPGDDGADSGGDNIAPYDFTNTPLSAANNFTTLYALTTAQVAAFGSIMWASLADPNFWHAVGVEFSNDFSINPADMMRYFNFLRYYPFDLTPYSSQYISGIYIGRSTIPIQFPSGMEYPRRASRNLIQIDGGEVTALLPAPYNSDDFFVSDPATQIQAHIPFCGTVQLSAAECYGRKLYLDYVVDLQSGAIQATIAVQSDSYYIVATLAGTCGAGVQITANNNIEYLTRIATVATSGISSAATMATRGAQVAGAEGAAAAGVVGALTGTISALAGLPPVTVHKQGSTTGFANYGGDPQAYITIQAPKRSIPDTYAKSAGYVSNKRARIGDLSGYTEMINPDLSGIAAHQDELAAIYNILQAGFFA